MSTENFLDFIWHKIRGRQEMEVCNIVQIRCADTQRHMSLANIQDDVLLRPNAKSMCEG
jgi:hypothetical protein